MDLLKPFIDEHAIDVTAFIGSWPNRLQASAEQKDLSRMADRYQLKGVCISHIASVFGYDTRSGNEALFKACSQDNRLWPFAIINPTDEGWLQELQWAIDSGVRGIRLIPGYHQYKLDHPAVNRLIEIIEPYRLPLHVCARLQDERLQHHRFYTEAVPVHSLASMISAAGDNPLIISGVNSNEKDEISRYLHADQSIDHVLYDLWHVNGPLAVISQLCQKGQASQYAFGSCTPIQTAEATILQLSAANISESDRRLLCCGNAERLLSMVRMSG
ncbi:amidohydrolase family protein [Cohnella silvisoli]|uniref:Amidohydrolase n=1 Tax=Cohnella silvisoli TaxID=2873699 RepID=A0ABV1L119_9BACL|nr:amidohydrolase [Cohnella silvisoli]MCD9025309.1 amidohydrolase [Cohnella silvisoli]